MTGETAQRVEGVTLEGWGREKREHKRFLFFIELVALFDFLNYVYV